MAVTAGCPRCPRAIDVVAPAEGVCAEHGRVGVLWRPDQVDYDHFAQLIGFPDVQAPPAYLPWPLSPGWEITDFGWVGADRRTATVTTTSGHTDPDGHVELSLVVEDPGVGLGARVAGAPAVDPGPVIARGQADIRVRADGKAVSLWSVDVTDQPDVPDEPDPLPRSVFAGEAHGRWLWLVVSPAPAMLLLRDEWLLADVSGFGPEALAMPFGERRSSW